jgi:Tfp pilus assembly protein PilO
VSSLKTDRTRLQTNLQTLRGVVTNANDTKATVQRITTSLDRFETESLPRQDQGRMDLYEELNALIIKNGVRNTSGPTYAALEPEGTRAAGGRTVITKWQSFYPGVAVVVTVEGQYENIRRFIRDVEKSKQFLVINEVELQRARDTNAPMSAEGDVASESGQPAAAPVSGTRGSLVSLQLSMATYFQREAAVAAPASQE